VEVWRELQDLEVTEEVEEDQLHASNAKVFRNKTAKFVSTQTIT
jgi:hypothetical protein